MIYKFKIRNIDIELKAPTQEAFDEFFEDSFLKVLINDEFKAQIKADLQVLIDTKTYEEVEDGKEC